MQKHSGAPVGNELSRFLIVYLLMLLGILMLMHILQPAGHVSGSSSRSPVQQERQSAG
jgi:hypothetical protein